MKNLNAVHLIGRIVRQPEFRQSATGSSYVRFSLATNRSWKTKDGTMKEAVDFHSMVAFGAIAENISKYVTKGMLVYMAGRLSNNKIKSPNGQEYTVDEVIVNDMIMLDKKTAEGTDGNGIVPPQTPVNESELKEIFS